MKAIAGLVLLSAMSLAVAACGSDTKQAATTFAGVGVTTNGPPPTPNTLSACAQRWNSPANAGGRRAAKRQAPKADTALVQKATSSGYFSHDAGRCLIYLITPPKSAIVFIETAPGTFTYTADATGHFSANADVQASAAIQLH